ncbi:VC0807 family protein [Paenibacillus cremeus]|uniref:Intracellular septation protein A n=1 Tax=Paenibacillus cremeus TaxID=2163881 RepID=A0A559KFK7_9BACL|nr:VC0807 family protein [Paenibacillus cremeus]TVY10911.1 hypothetical protein FPZ49_05365 [Paenibacillus cremeus]
MSMRTYVMFTLIINGVVPWALYVWLSDYMGGVAALSIATLIPLVDNIVHLIKNRKFDAFGSLMLFTFLLTLGLVMLGGSEKILLVRESLITASVGIVFLGSMLFRRPLMFFLAKRFVANNEFDVNWKYPYFRFVMRLMTIVWGISLTSEAAVRIVMVFNMSTEQYLALTNFVLYGFVGATVLWTVAYRRHSRDKFNAMKPTLH